MTTIKDLLTYFENYYGEKYSGVVRDTMTGYLKKFSPVYYQTIAKVIVMRYSRSFGKSPGPAEIESNWQEIRDTVPRPQYLPEPAEPTSEEDKKEIEKMLNRFLHRTEGATA